VIRKQLYILLRELTRSRVLAALLLASIAWGSTIEFTHHHGDQSAKSFDGHSTQSQTATLDDATAQIRVETGQPKNSSSKSTDGSECLICQLHFNLATTLFSKPASVPLTETRAAISQLTSFLRVSEFTATQHGRAPPMSL